MVKGILFDFNGTMFFDGEKHHESWNNFSIKYRNKSISDEEMKYMHGQNNCKIIENLLKNHNLSNEDKIKLSKEKEKIYRELCYKDKKNTHLVAGLENLLDQLKKMNIPMNICSASIEDNIDFYFSTFGLDQWFDRDKVVYDDGFHEDKVSMFRDGAKNIGVPIKDCMVIEDSYSGIQFAYKSGVEKIIAITTPDKYDEYIKLQNVCKVIFDYQDFDFSILTNN